MDTVRRAEFRRFRLNLSEFLDAELRQPGHLAHLPENSPQLKLTPETTVSLDFIFLCMSLKVLIIFHRLLNTDTLKPTMNLSLTGD